MIEEYVIKLIDNLPDEIKNRKEPLLIDVVLDGGIFNGSYLVGALYFLKEMEKRKYITIDRISGCSVGAIVAFLYYMDALDLMPKLYEVVNKDFRQTYRLHFIKEIKKYLAGRIPEDILTRINKKLFITYNNIKNGTKPVKSNYKDVDDVINTIIRSSFIPFLIDGNILYQNKCIDGITPYVFTKEAGKKILYLDLYGYDKIGNLLNVKNEKTNFHRILSGLLDIHSFFIKQSSTQMCSYVNEWTITNKGLNYCKLCIEMCCIYLTYFFILIKDNISDDFKNTVLYKILSKIGEDVFIIILENYCL
jgi:hypothetical protein